MRYPIRLLALAASICLSSVALADSGQAGAPSTAPRAQAPAPARHYSYQRGRCRWGLFTGSSQNWYRSRGTPADNSTIPTPVNRNPKGLPPGTQVIFPKNM